MDIEDLGLGGLDSQWRSLNTLEARCVYSMPVVFMLLNAMTL